MPSELDWHMPRRFYSWTNGLFDERALHMGLCG